MNKAKKGKIIMTVSIGCVAFILVMVMFTQFKTVEETDITGIEIMREAELRTELASWKSKYEDTISKIEETENKKEQYTNEINNNNDIASVLQSEVEGLEMYAGYLPVKGEGIIITLKDTNNEQISSSDLLTLVNELKGAGAEAISINGNRIVSTTDITWINYTRIVINTNNLKTGVNPIYSPYVVKAIGNQKYLESAINLKYGYIDSMTAYNKDVSYSLANNITVEAYDGNLDYTYAKEVE